MPREYVRIVSACNEKFHFEWPTQLVQIEGFSLPPVERRTVRAPFQHGETYLGFSFQARSLQLTFHLRGTSRQDLWARRRQLAAILNPLAGPFYLQLCTLEGDIYTLRDVVPDSQMTAIVGTAQEPTVQATSIRLVAHDPAWYGPERHEETAAPTPASELTFPASFSIMFDVDGALSEVLTIVTQGDFTSWPTITLYGPMENPRVSNLTTGEDFGLNYTLSVGEVVTIDTSRKTVTSSIDDESLFGYITDTTDFATFHLEPHPVAEYGVNQIQCTAVGGTESSRFVISWHDRYSGL